MIDLSLFFTGIYPLIGIINIILVIISFFKKKIRIISLVYSSIMLLASIGMFIYAIYFMHGWDSIGVFVFSGIGICVFFLTTISSLLILILKRDKKNAKNKTN